MPNIKNIKTKLDSVSAMKQIFISMECTDSDKLKKLNKQISTYQSFMWDFFSIIWSIWNSLFCPVASDIKKKKLFLVYSSNRWFCGNSNDKLFKKVIWECWSKIDNIDVFCIWKKAFEFFAKKWFNVVWYLKLSDNFVQEDLSEVYEYVISGISNGLYWEIAVYSNFLKNKVCSKSINYNLYPVDKSSLFLFMDSIWLDYDKLSSSFENASLLWSSDDMKKEIERQLIQYILYWVALQNKLTELSTRVSMIKNMKTSTDFIVKDLRLSFNRVCQSLLTREISSIMELETTY